MQPYAYKTRVLREQKLSLITATDTLLVLHYITILIQLEKAGTAHQPSRTAIPPITSIFHISSVPWKQKNHNPQTHQFENVCAFAIFAQHATCRTFSFFLHKRVHGTLSSLGRIRRRIKKEEWANGSRGSRRILKKKRKKRRDHSAS